MERTQGRSIPTEKLGVKEKASKEREEPGRQEETRESGVMVAKSPERCEKEGTVTLVECCCAEK